MSLQDDDPMCDDADSIKAQDAALKDNPPSGHPGSESEAPEGEEHDALRHIQTLTTYLCSVQEE